MVCANLAFGFVAVWNLAYLGCLFDNDPDIQERVNQVALYIVVPGVFFTTLSGNMACFINSCPKHLPLILS